jgi:hypothetical protein
MVTVVSRQLLAAGAAWDDGPEAGAWIADRLGPFGPSVGHAVPLGYPAYAIVPIQWDENDEEAAAPAIALGALFDVLGPFTEEQSVHSGIWPGFGWMHVTRAGRRTGAGVGFVEGPDAEPLALPQSEYYLWTGPLRSALAFREHAESPPSLVWPDDRSWFVGAPIYTNEIAVAGPSEIIDAVLAEPHLLARSSAPDEDLDGDD